jgi:hypothetical protein
MGLYLEVLVSTALRGGLGLQNTYFAETLWLFVVLTMLTMLGRAAFVFPLSFLHNVWSREKLTVKEMIVIW